MVPSPRHAWTLGRILSGRKVDESHLNDLLPPFRAIGRRMWEMPEEHRLALWEAYLDGQDDQEAINLAVANVDPEGPQPEGATEEESAEDWGPIRLGAIPPAEPFPLEILPGPARELADAVAQSVSCPGDFPAVACLAAAGGAVGRSVILRIKEGYFESASLYLALVGDSSDGKTPALDAAMEPIRAIATRLHEEYQEDLTAWEKSPEESRGERPKARRIDTSNPTVEALAPILAANPRGGPVVLPDEFAGLVLSMGQYKSGKGADKQFYLSVWSGSRVVIDRKQDAGNPTVVPRPFLTVAGGLTPGRLGTLASDGGDEDGFMSRLLFSYPAPLKGRRYSERGIPDGVADSWRALIDKLWRRPMLDLDGRPVPHVVNMTPEARDEWRKRCQDHLDEQESESFPRSLKGPWGKLQSYAGRLALILHLAALATDPARPDDEMPDLDRRTIEDAWRLVAYFKSHARRIYSSIRGMKDEGSEDVRALLGWIVRGHLAEFSIRDVGKNFDRFGDDRAALADALAWMAARNLIRPKPEPKSGKPRTGRKPSPRYEANPELWRSPRFRQFRQIDSDSGNIDGNDGIAAPLEGR